MRNLLLCGAFVAVAAAPAFAQDAAPWTISANVDLATDYTFRGLSQTDGSPAIQGGFDAAFGQFYVGAWASNVDFGFSESIELDLYGGFKFNAGPVALDLGIIGYLYPDAADDGLAQGTGELDYAEGYVKASIAPADGVTLGASVFYSPEFTAETGDAYYVELNGSYAAAPNFSLSGAVGYQDIDNVYGIFGSKGDSYTTWNVGGTYSNWGVSFDLRYVGTDVGSSDDIVTSAFTTAQKADDRIIFTLKKAM